MAGAMPGQAARWLRGGGVAASTASLPLGYLQPPEPLFGSLIRMLVALAALLAIAGAWWGAARPTAWQRFVLIRAALRVPVVAAVVGWAVIDRSPLFGRLLAHGPGAGLVLLLGGAVAYEVGAARGLRAAARGCGGVRGHVPGGAGVRAAAARGPGKVGAASIARAGADAAGFARDAAVPSLVAALGGALLAGGAALLAGRAGQAAWSASGALWAATLAAGCATVVLTLRDWRAASSTTDDAVAPRRGWPLAALATCALACAAVGALVAAVLAGGAQVQATGYVTFLCGWVLTLVGASAHLGCRWCQTRRRAHRG